MIELEVFGLPAAQGSKSAIVIGGRPRIVEGKSSGQRAKHRAWREDVRAAFVADDRALVRQPWTGPVAVEVTFWVPRPKSAPKRIVLPCTSPDLDKQCRSTLDALTGLLYVDDRQVVTLYARRRFATDRPDPHTTKPGATIRASEVPS